MAKQCRNLTLLAVVLSIGYTALAFGSDIERVGKMGSRFVFKVNGVVVSVGEGDSIDGCSIAKIGLDCDNSVNTGSVVNDMEKRVADAEAKAADASARYDALRAKLNSVVVSSEKREAPPAIVAAPQVSSVVRNVAEAGPADHRPQALPIIVRPRQSAPPAQPKADAIMPAPPQSQAQAVKLPTPVSVSLPVKTVKPVPVRSIVGAEPAPPAVPSPPTVSGAQHPTNWNGNGDLVGSLKALAENTGKTISVSGVGDIRYATIRDRLVVQVPAHSIRRVEAIFGGAIQQTIKGDNEYYLLVPVSFLDGK